MKKLVNFVFILFLFIGIFQTPISANNTNEDNKCYLIVNGRKFGNGYDSNTNYYIQRGLFTGRQTIKYKDGTRETFKEIVIPGNFQYIDVCGFSDCRNLEKVTLNEGIKAICGAAFRDCENLKSISIPKSVEYIQSDAFKGCINLKSIILPEGIEAINTNTFMGCKSLESINIPKSVKEICKNAFRDCSSLKKISIPNGVEKIFSGAFAYCGMENIKIPNSVKFIYRRYYDDECDPFKGIDTVYYNGTATGSPWGAKRHCRY